MKKSLIAFAFVFILLGSAMVMAALQLCPEQECSKGYEISKSQVNCGYNCSEKINNGSHFESCSIGYKGFSLGIPLEYADSPDLIKNFLNQYNCLIPETICENNLTTNCSEEHPNSVCGNWSYCKSGKQIRGCSKTVKFSCSPGKICAQMMPDPIPYFEIRDCNPKIFDFFEISLDWFKNLFNIT